MITEAEYKRLKALADTAKSERDKALGQLDAAMTTLRDEFGCNTIEKAQKKLKELNEEADAGEEAYNAAKAKFEQDWDERLP